MTVPRSAYIHVPFCARRCGYCDFTLVAGQDRLIGDYLRALTLEMEPLPEGMPLDTLFFGGGTPTHPAPDQLRQLFAIVRRHFTLMPGYEFTIEANPNDLTDEKIGVLAEAGVNRVSLGVQSFDADVLRVLERSHSGEEVIAAIERLRPIIPNLSVDLIFGVPGQSLSLWRETLRQAVELGVTHVSTYGLTFEKGTAFWSRLQRGELATAPEELEREMYAAAMEGLAAAGFEQYEISSFARAGFRCRHNEVYWTGEPYFAFGPGAARYINGRRETNVRGVTGWLNRVLHGQSPVGESEELSPEDRAREAIVLGLRRCEGIDRDEFARRTGFDLQPLAGDTIRRYVSRGLLEECGSRIRLTREGRFLADSVVVDFL